ncbi:MAG: hypothetical protein AAGJ93_11450 [Bacteroidota bacterium]
MLLQALYNNDTVRSKLLHTLSYLLLYFVGLNILLPFVPAERVNYPVGGSLTDMIHAAPSLVHQTSVLALGANAYYMASVIVFLLIPFLDPARAGKNNRFEN